MSQYHRQEQIIYIRQLTINKISMTESLATANQIIAIESPANKQLDAFISMHGCFYFLTEYLISKHGRQNKIIGLCLVSRF